MSKAKALAASLLMFGFITCAPVAQAETGKPMVIEMPDPVATPADLQMASWFSHWTQWFFWNNPVQPPPPNRV